MFGLIVLIPFIMTGCKLYEYPPKTEMLAEEALPPGTLIPEQWITDSTRAGEVREDWYQQFDDPVLNRYIAEALDTTNPNIIVRLARIRASEANMQLARSSGALFVNYSAAYSGSYATGSANTSDLKAGIPVSWEADLWGRIAAGVEAANEFMLSEVHQLDYTRLSVAADVATLYFDIGAQYELLDLGNQFIVLTEEVISIFDTRQRVGIEDAKAGYLARARLNEIRDVITQNENTLQRSIRQLKVLLGRYPDSVMDSIRMPDRIPGPVQLSVPYELLQRRPDILSLESQVRQVFFLKEQARLARYPSLVLSVTPGISSLDGLILSPLASLTGPVLNGRAIRAQIDQMEATEQQVIADYGNAVLHAFREVETFLNSAQLLDERLKYARAASDEYSHAYQVALDQYRVGQTDLLDVLIIQSQYLGSRTEEVKITLLACLNRIELCKSLGGTVN